MFILKKGHQPGVYVPLRALFLVMLCFVIIPPAYEVYRGYIVFAFSVYMFVCVFVNFFLSKISRKLSAGRCVSPVCIFW